MKKILFVLAVAAGLCSCAKEDWFENIQPEINFFAVPENATGEEADLKREFYNETGIYLLFNDTLGMRETTTLSGEIAIDYKTVDFFWNMTTGETYVDSLRLYYYKDIMHKRSAAQFVQDNILTNLPESFCPYSILLLDSLVFFQNSSGIYESGESIITLPALQCMAIAVGDVTQLTQEDVLHIQTEILQEVVVSRITLIPEEEFEVFYSYSEEYYDIYTFTVPKPVQSVGFLETYSNDWTIDFNTREYDKLAFVERVFELSETEFRTVYEEYPIVIAKMEELVRILNKYGVNVY